MNKHSDYKELKDEAYRIISEHPCCLFPEFEFRRNSKGWCSANTLKIDGTQGTARGKVWIYDSRPGFLFDFRGDVPINFWDYLEKVRNDPSPFQTLLDYAGLSLPQVQHNPTAKVELVADIHPFILRKCLEIFADELGNSEIGCEVRAYLAIRGYDDTEITRMKLGALPDIEDLRKKLQSSLDIEQKYINFFLGKLYHQKNGVTYSYFHHRLTIPCYGKHGKLEGFVFRTIDPSRLPEGESKYKNLSNMNRDAGILHVPRGTTELIIVEGVLDALLAKAKGARNVVSLNGSGLNEAQADMLAAEGIKRVILCLDNDDTGHDSTYRITMRLLEHEHSFEVYIAALPEAIKDVDQLITEKDMDAFYDTIYYAIGMGEYLATQLQQQFPKRDEIRPLPSMQRRRLLDAAEPIRQQLQAFPLELGDFERFINNFVK